MTLRIENLHKSLKVRGAASKLFDGLNLSVERGARVGILGLPKSGKTTLLGIICGSERSYTGRVFRDMTSSWIIPFSDFFLPTSTMAWGLRFVARLYGIRDPDFATRVARMAEAAQYVNMTHNECPRPIKQQLAFALGLAMDFDLYLLDDAAVFGAKEFREAGKALLAERTAGRAVVIATSNEGEVAANCDLAYVLENGRASYFGNVGEGVGYFKQLKKAEEERQKQLAKKGLDEDAGAVEAGPDSGLDLLAVGVSDL